MFHAHPRFFSTATLSAVLGKKAKKRADKLVLETKSEVRGLVKLEGLLSMVCMEGQWRTDME